MKKSNPSRTAATQVLLDVVQNGLSFHPRLMTPFKLKPVDHAFATHLCFGVLRFYQRLESLITQFLHRPLKDKDFDVQLLMMMGLFQLHYTDTPAFAAIHATVETTTDIKKPWAKGLINSVLRQAQRQGNAISEKDNILIQTAHPLWLTKALQTAWPQAWENIIEANLTHPPLVLRVNQRKISRDDYITMLTEANIAALPITFCNEGILLNEPLNVELLPKFAEGFVSVQDGAAQLAAGLLALKPGMRVLDACAAPGGKMAHILETEPNLRELLAIDIDPHRKLLLASTLKRLNLSAKVISADASCPENWWDNEPFDCILLDAPCSATGVIRRHPDIKLHRQPEDIQDLTEIQAQLLANLWPLLKPQGVLLYATCSVLPEENVAQITDFLAKHADAQECPIEANWGITQRYGRQILPGMDNMDGFYYARLTKAS